VTDIWQVTFVSLLLTSIIKRGSLDLGSRALVSPVAGARKRRAAVPRVVVGAWIRLPRTERNQLMKSALRKSPLLVTEILRHGTTLCADQKVSTATADGYRDTEFGAISSRVTQLLHRWRSLGVNSDQRSATFTWSNQEQLEALCAVPGVGTVLHTRNIRLSPSRSPILPTEPRFRW
jgi:hypothetical protein